MRVCLVYDLFSPFTIGGAERWYRDLGDRLAAQGHSVTYLTLRHWPRGEHPELPGIEVRAVGPRFRMYAHGRRRMLPPLVFGLGVLAHLLRHGRRYDVVHTCSFPYFSVLAAAATRRLHGFRLFVDWFEVWTREYWREYLGPAGVLGWLVQRRCIHVKQRAFCFSSLFERRLRDEGFRGEITRLSGLYGGLLEAPRPRPPEDVVVFAGRHIPEKRVPAIPPAVARARERVPSLRAELYGDGPDRDKVLRLVRELGLEGVVEAPGFVEAERVEDALARALSLVLPSRREGYGLVVVEAASHGTPSVLVAGDDNAASELLQDGENGVLAQSADPDALAAAILRIHESAEAFRASTAQWFARHRDELSIDTSLEQIVSAYGAG